MPPETDETVNFLAQKRKKILLDKHSPTSSRENPFDDFYYKEIAQLTEAGGYSVDFLNKTSSIDPQGKRILKIFGEFSPTLSDLLELYVQDERERVVATFKACAAGTPFKTTVRMRKTDGEEFWAKAIGKPKYGKNGNIVGIQGVFQDVSNEKKKADELKKSLKTIASKNSQLLNFAQLVSHNLKSNVSNLNMAMELLQQSANKNEETELIDGMTSITEELCNTVKNLAQIAHIQESSNAQKQTVSFQDTLQSIKKELENKIGKSRTEIFSDFSEAPTIPYLPTYLASILRNLINNAIQFRHKDRNPVIDIYSVEINDKIRLLIKDNGSGFDAEKYGDQIFKLYQTFHQENHGRGTGLFMVKNQVEALGGTISVKSQPENGTTFTIHF